VDAAADSEIPVDVEKDDAPVDVPSDVATDVPPDTSDTPDPPRDTADADTPPLRYNPCGGFSTLIVEGAVSRPGDECGVFDDGVLVWVRLDKVGGEEPLDSPVLPARPAGSHLAAVTRLEGACEPRDIIANRLDPWHGAWFHPYSFAQLEVLSAPPVDADEDSDVFTVAVTFHLGLVGMPVITQFSVPEPRTVVMHIVEGEGVGSVVETHATPIDPGPDGRPRTAVIEAVIAQSDRTGFQLSLLGAPLLRPLMKLGAARLWRDDLAYAERRYSLRSNKTH
jgi:hypothetical protein